MKTETTYAVTGRSTLAAERRRDRDIEVGLVSRQRLAVELSLVGIPGGPGEQGLAEDGVGLGVDDGDVGAADMRDGQGDLDGDGLARGVRLHVGGVVAELHAAAQPEVALRSVVPAVLGRELRQPLDVRRLVPHDVRHH